MALKMIRWYVMLVWNFYAIGAKMMALLTLRFVNRVILQR